MKEHTFTFETEVVEYLADVMENEVNRTALAGANGGQGDLGALHLAAMFRRETR